MISTPIAFLIFNRPDLTAQVFARIAAAKPTSLFIIADGPRTAAERAACDDARAVTLDVGWPCEVKRLYSEENLGCGRRVSSGLRWLFSQVGEAIILEDDCLPHPALFGFCEELLNRYRHETRVTMISGCSFLPDLVPPGTSYGFSRYAMIWGWATWARAWSHYDFHMSTYPNRRQEGWLDTVFDSRAETEHWRAKFDGVLSGEIDTWDYQWLYACWAHGGLGIVPRTNLVTNIGYGPRATHATTPGRLAAVPSKAIALPLAHPEQIYADPRAEVKTFAAMFGAQPRTVASVLRGIRRRLKGVRSTLDTRRS